SSVASSTASSIRSSVASSTVSSSIRSSVASSTVSSSIRSSVASSSVSSSIRSSIASSSGSSVTINVDRSLFVHDTATLQAADFSLRSTLQQLVNQLNASNPSNTTTPEQLFARMWDTQNPTPGLVAGGEKCTGVLNGFAVECRPAEGAQANNPAAAINNYIPISLVNRLDLRNTVSLSDCGEHRVIYANQGGARNFIIFEAQLPNPTPGVAAGCLPVAQFWQNLSAENNAILRATALRNFFFSGIPGSNVRAVIDIRNYATATGQVRTNMFMGNTSWNLKEFKVGINPQGLSMIAPVSVKSNPVAFLFDGNNTDSRAPQFRTDFVANMGSLLTGIDTFSLTVANDAHNNGQSHASFPTAENEFNNAFSNTNANAFQTAVANRITSLSSTLTSTQVMNRATAMTCGGCHQPGFFGLTLGDAIGPGQTWPDTLGFTHVSEFASAGVFPISPALIGTFLPARLAGLKSFLSNPGSAAPQAEPGALIRTGNTVETSPTDAPKTVTPEQPFNKRAG
ncbi:MAG: hypothetical protein V4732_17245, partial [Pseudomonadota bacterium]